MFLGVVPIADTAMAPTHHPLGLDLRDAASAVTTAFRHSVRGALDLFYDALEVTEARCDWEAARADIDRAASSSRR
jgi:hypothetical protein